MARKSDWLPGQDGREPAGDRDWNFAGFRQNRNTPPIYDVVLGVFFVVIAAALSIVLFGFVPHLTLGAVLVGLFGSLVFLVFAVFYLQRGGRRWAWRRHHTAETGGRYFRPWEEYPPRNP